MVSATAATNSDERMVEFKDLTADYLAEMIRKTAEGATLVMIDRSGGSPPQAVLDAVVKRLEAKGPRVVVFDQRCGLAH